MTVVDASVAVKWLTAEERRDAANRILEGADKLIGPALLRVETAAAITRKALLSEVTVQEAHEALEVWAAIIRGTLDLMPEDEDLSGALKLALELKHALQDCIYLALAERLDATLITADGKFVAKARGRYPRVQLLGAES